MAIRMDVVLGAVYDEYGVLVNPQRTLAGCYCRIPVIDKVWNHPKADGTYDRGGKGYLYAVNEDEERTIIKPIKRIIITEAAGTYTHGGDTLAELYAQAMLEFPGAVEA